MRRTFFKCLHELISTNRNIIALTGDLGFGGFDNIQKDFPENFLNCGASEHSMLGIACGLALNGKIPVVYSITPFLIYRGYEVIRNYIDHEKIPVKLFGSGRDNDYKHDGFSHDASDIRYHMRGFRNIASYYPDKKEDIEIRLKEWLESREPVFVSLVR